MKDANRDMNSDKRRSLTQYSLVEELRHGKMVSNLAYWIGKELGLEEDELHDLVVAGFFHDIGKMELDLESEQESDMPMIVEEMNSVRQHPLKGYDILKRHGYSDDICEAVLHHHENYDGSGYPDNLEGWNIPLPACILRVCDVFCALISDRPYRSAFPAKTAMEMMIEEIRKYDVKVFLAFQRSLHTDEGGDISIPEVAEEVRGVWRTIWNLKRNQ